MTQENNRPEFDMNSEMRALTSIQKQGLLVGLIPCLHKGFLTHNLATGIDRRQLHRLLTDMTHPKPAESIVEKLDFLRYEGNRSAYSILLPTLLSAQNKTEAQEKVNKQFFGIKRFTQQVQALYQFMEYIQDHQKVSITTKDLEKGILAWDMGELVILARIAAGTQYIDEDTAWMQIEYARNMCQENFKYGEEIGKSYLIGQAMEQNEPKGYDRMIACFVEATEQMSHCWR